MRFVSDWFEKGSITPITLTASVLVGFVTFVSILLMPEKTEPVADMYLTPQSGTYVIGDTFVVTVDAASKVPANVFAGELVFNPNILRILAINYNTSIADLWAERPWYSNGAGTLNFIGGTTQEGGFVGADTLITVTFEAIGEGNSALILKDARILQHDGLGSDAQLAEPIDSIYTVIDPRETLSREENPLASGELHIVPKPPSTDLNGDGKQTVADVSIFMLDLARGNKRSDFNQDGSVGTKDLSILMNAQ